MAEALQLFNFQAPSNTTELRIPQQVKPKKRKRKDIIVAAKGEEINYWCDNCGKSVAIATTAAVQCTYCNTRFVQKLRPKKPIQYDAI